MHLEACRCARPPRGCRRAGRRARACRSRRARRRCAVGRSRGTGFATLMLELAAAEGELDLRAAGAVAGGVGERLLEDPVRGLLDAGRRAGGARRGPRPSRPGRRRGGVRRARRARPARPAARPRRRSEPRRPRAGPSTICSISPTVSRATSSIVANASRAASGSSAARMRPSPAWTRITLIAWPAESCRSRAIRVRSSAAARRRSRSASRSARSARSSSSSMRSRRSRARSPASQAPPQTSTPNRISTPGKLSCRRPAAVTCATSSVPAIAQVEPHPRAGLVAGRGDPVEREGRAERRADRDRRRPAARWWPAP